MAHIYAVAAMAGVNHGLRSAHDYGVDGQFDPVIVRKNRRVVSGHPLAFQAKATTVWKVVGDNIIYDLEVKTYNDIVTRDSSQVTLLLILLCLPKDQADWHTVTPDGTVVRNCCYWAVLKGEISENTSTTRIQIPVKNVLSPDMLKDLLDLEKQRRETQWP